MPELDRFDRQLLTLVQQDAALTAEQLAEQVSLSASAIQRRLKRLREQGVITRQVALLDPDQIGRPMVFIASVALDSERSDQVAALRAWIAAQAQVQQAFYVTGEADFILIVTAPDAQAYESLMARLLAEHPNVKRYTTSVAMNVLKRGLALPVPPAPSMPSGG